MYQRQARELGLKSGNHKMPVPEKGPINCREGTSRVVGKRNVLKIPGDKNEGPEAGCNRQKNRGRIIQGENSVNFLNHVNFLFKISRIFQENHPQRRAE